MLLQSIWKSTTNVKQLYFCLHPEKREQLLARFEKLYSLATFELTPPYGQFKNL